MSKKKNRPLAICVRNSLKLYLKDLNGESPADLYDMVISQVEKPLLEIIMRCAENNQCRAAQMLGINRNTLRKKLRDHGLN
ncbi:DNA-binding protein Fis [bacterium BMS3Bbin11]|nr:DNA-binding protein Fis [bacterium BMS3Abin11]GBE46144.1 DNA-binding protein Fis [bacterium BMS3Bbin11]GMT40706.1 MAG: Fis family transcriptional regulator [bacterium]HDH08131.1 Fis family transcriptional regulator [Gammaproteobacteria bacterium]HDH17141.1 Fis family transcriptional regulator [Gammaproteobacteria bacterium]